MDVRTKEAVLAGLPALGQLLLEVVEIAAVEEASFLQEADEHQTVQEHRGGSAALPLIANVLDQFAEGEVLLLEVAGGAFGYPLDVESVSDSSGTGILPAVMVLHPDWTRGGPLCRFVVPRFGGSLRGWRPYFLYASAHHSA